MKHFDLGQWAQMMIRGTPAKGQASSIPQPPGPTSEEVVKGMVEWMRKNHAFDRPDNPPSWVADEATWDRAKKAVEPYWDRYGEPYAVVTHVYQNMGGGIK